MIAAGLLSPSSGAVMVDGRKVERPRTDIGIVFQSPVLLDWRTALGNVMLQAEARKMDRKEAEVAPATSWHRSGSAASRPGIRTSFRAACASVSRSAARSFTIPITYSWMSRSARLML